MRINPLLCTDSYKVTHWKQYPPQTSRIYSYFEARGGRYPATCFFGLQALLKMHFVGSRVCAADVDEARELCRVHFGQDFLNAAGWKRLVDDYGGRYPVRIRATPEGLWVPTSNVLMTIENTDPRYFWLTNYLETLLVQVWYPMTVSTVSGFLRAAIGRYLEMSGSPELLPTRLHDFGCRGASSVESAALGGAGHLVHFDGTDTLPAVQLVRDDYGGEIFGRSIPAAEHSTVTSWTQSGEIAAYRNMLASYPTGTVAVVSDSYDLLEAVDAWSTTLKDAVLARDGVLVIRPDSGDPWKNLRQTLAVLSRNIGCEENAKGYRVLHPKVRLIQGDGVDPAAIERLLGLLTSDGWSADNLAFGMGGGLLQKVDRDTCECAFKCSWAEVDGTGRDVYKLAPGKRSKRGRLGLIRDDSGALRTVPEAQAGTADELITVFENGALVAEHTFTEIRERAAASWSPEWHAG